MVIPMEWIYGIATAIVTLSGAIWAYIRKQHEAIITRVDNQAKRLEGKLDKCEERHLERDKQTLELAQKVGELSGMEDMTKRVEKITQDLIKELKQ